MSNRDRCMYAAQNTRSRTPYTHTRVQTYYPLEAVVCVCVRLPVHSVDIFLFEKLKLKATVTASKRRNLNFRHGIRMRQNTFQLKNDIKLHIYTRTHTRAHTAY